MTRTDGSHTPLYAHIIQQKKFERAICVARDKGQLIESLTTQGCRNGPIEEVYCRMWPILFENKPAGGEISRFPAQKILSFRLIPKDTSNISNQLISF